MHKTIATLFGLTALVLAIAPLPPAGNPVAVVAGGSLETGSPTPGPFNPNQ
jgi:hypothetical protein